MKLPPAQLGKHLQGPLASIYVVSGDEPLLCQEVADAIRAAARKHGFDERQVFNADASFDWGGPAWDGEDQPTGIALERMRYAATLARASGLPLMTSGGLHYGEPPSEAEIMARSLKRDFGMSTRWLEPQSRTTWENATFSAALLKAQGISKVVVVTQAWHMTRARWSFERAGLQVVSAPVGFLSRSTGRPFGGWVPDAKAFWQNSQLLNEAIGQLGYRLFY